MDFGGNWMNSEHSTGTTIMAMEFDGGVVLGADSRTSTGAFVANRVADKLTPVTDKIYCCRSGSAADTQAISDIVAYSLYYKENTTGEEPLVSEAASEFRNFCYNYRDSLVAGIIVAGWDDRLGGQVYSVPLGGMFVRRGAAIGGSGSSYIFGLVKELYREGMSKEECVQLVLKTIKQAMYHDGSSGGVIRICVITKDGVERDVHYATKNNSQTVLMEA